MSKAHTQRKIIFKSFINTWLVVLHVFLDLSLVAYAVITHECDEQVPYSW